MIEAAAGLIVGFCYRGSDLASRAIEWWGGGYYYHATTLLPGGRFVLDSRLKGGVAIRRISYLVHDHVRWLKFPCTSIQRDAALVWLHSQLDKPYDTDGIIDYIDGSIIDKNFRRESAWFCDDLSVVSWEQAGIIPRLQFPPFRIAPGGAYLIADTAGAKRVDMHLRSGALIESVPP